MWSLRKIKENILWIRDRYGAYGAGTYYLGTNFPDKKFEFEIQNIIRKFAKDKTCYFCGTSKGGSAALYYGLNNNADFIVAGSPQYYIGDYLCENEYHKELLRGISSDKDCIKKLNTIISSVIREKKVNSRIFLLISSCEKSYEHHLKPLIEDLKKFQNVNVFDARYNDHNDVGYHFPNYLISIIKENIKND